MRGKHLPITSWLTLSNELCSPVYLDVGVWEKFIEWIEPKDPTDIRRLENIKHQKWSIFIFKDILNRCFGLNRKRDELLRSIGIKLIDATGPARVTSKDDLFIAEVLRVYFDGDNSARRQAEFLLLARRHSANDKISVISQHKNFSRIPLVDSYYLDDILNNQNDLPAFFDFLSDFEIHRALVNSIGTRIHEQNYSDILLNSIIALCNHVRSCSGLQVDGQSLMEQAFGGNPPPIYLNSFTDRNSHSSQQNEQKGFQKLYTGIIQAVRNPLAHEGTTSQFAQTRIPDRKTLYKYLSFISLLCERADHPLP